MSFDDIKSIFRLHNKSTLSKNIFTVFSGTAIAQAIQVIGAPILAYYFGPGQFGVFALYISFSSLIAILATARYEMAIVLPERKEQSATLVLICFIITILVSLLSLILIYPFSDYISEVFKSVALKKYLLLVPVSVLGTGLFQSLYYYALREKKFKTLSIIKSLQAFIYVICPLAMYFAGFSESGLIYGYVLHQLIAVVIILLSIPSAEIFSMPFSKAEARSLLLRYKNMPGLNALHAFSDSVQAAAINFFISFCYGNQALGLYTMAYRVLRAPLGVIGAAVAQVVFQQMSENYNKGVSNYSLATKVIKYLSYLTVPLFIAIGIASPFIFRIFFSAEWKDTWLYIIYMSPWMAAGLVSSPLSHLPNITSRQFAFLLLSVGINLFAFTIFYIIYTLQFSIYAALFGFSLSWMLGIIILLYWFAQLSKKTNHRTITA